MTTKDITKQMGSSKLPYRGCDSKEVLTTKCYMKMESKRTRALRVYGRRMNHIPVERERTKTKKRSLQERQGQDVLKNRSEWLNIHTSSLIEDRLITKRSSCHTSTSLIPCSRTSDKSWDCNGSRNTIPLISKLGKIRCKGYSSSATTTKSTSDLKDRESENINPNISDVSFPYYFGQKRTPCTPVVFDKKTKTYEGKITSSRSNNKRHIYSLRSFHSVPSNFRTPPSNTTLDSFFCSVRRKTTKTLPLAKKVEKPISPTFSNNSVSSFSSLSRTGDIAPSWMKQTLQKCAAKIICRSAMKERNEPSRVKDSLLSGYNMFRNTTLEDLVGIGGSEPMNLFSPEQSFSSRKRGVCASSLLGHHGDEFSFTDGLSISRQSTSSYGFRRSRSRIFSPQSTKKFMDAAAAGSTLTNDSNSGKSDIIVRMERRSESLDETDDNSTESRSIDGFSLNSHLSDETLDDHGNILQSGKIDDPYSLPPARGKHSFSLGAGNFSESVFSPVDSYNGNTTSGKVSVDTERVVLEKMSSYEDLKFLIKELRKWENGQNSQACFGMSTACTVVPPNSWSSSRKVSFITWTTQELGFCLRFGGGTVNYLQTTSTKGSSALKKCEIALMKYNSKINKSSVNQGAYVKKTPGFETMNNSQPEIKAPISSINITTTSPLFPTPLIKPISKHTPDLIRHNNIMLNSNHLDNSLIGKFTSLKIENKGETFNQSNIKITSPIAIDIERKDNITPLAPLITLSNRADTFNTSLTQDNNMSCVSLGSHYRPSYETCIMNKPRYRYSTDNSVMDNKDFVSHMYGVSPHAKKVTLSTVQLALSLPRRKGCCTVFSPYCNQRNVSSDSLSAAETLDFDGVETPMLKQPEIWGSRPVPGKDWGQSNRCSENVISILQSWFEDAKITLEYCCADSYDYATNSSFPEQSSTSYFVHPSIVTTAANSQTLGIEFEANSFNCLESCDHDNDSATVVDVETLLADDAFEIESSIELKRQESVGATALEGLDLNDFSQSPQLIDKRRQKSLAKRRRMSICSSALDQRIPVRFSMIQSIPFVHTDMSTGSDHEINTKIEKHALNIPSIPSSTISKSHISHFSRIKKCSMHKTIYCDDILLRVFSFINEKELLCSASVVCKKWADKTTDAHVALMLLSVGFNPEVVYGHKDQTFSQVINNDNISFDCPNHAFSSLERSWEYLVNNFPCGQFLSKGSFKQVYRVWNSSVDAEEAISIIDVNLIENKVIIGAELAVSLMLSSLSRRNICPNFVIIRGFFTCAFEPQPSLWGNSKNMKSKGQEFRTVIKTRKPREPHVNNRSHFQYIRMEFCKFGDAEEYIKNQPSFQIDPEEARILLFQMAFSLHVAGDRFGLKHYDVKLLNFLLQPVNSKIINDNEHPFTVLRYGVGSHVFNLRMPTSKALLIKLADYGTANVQSESNGQPIIISNFTTLENSPPDFLILGDAAKQGYGHDCFGLGLCMLHLFTGHAPYEEMLEDVICPPSLKRKLKRIWEHCSSKGYKVVRSVIFSDVYEDEEGNLEGERDEVLYDTLYRFLVLFGIPKNKFHHKIGGKVWKAISLCLENGEKRPIRHNMATRGNCSASYQHSGYDVSQYHSDCMRFSLLFGKDEKIARARRILQSMEGGMELLFSLVSFDPEKRASPLDVINSKFMYPLRDDSKISLWSESDIVHNYMAYSTH